MKSLLILVISTLAFLVSSSSHAQNLNQALMKAVDDYALDHTDNHLKKIDTLLKQGADPWKRVGEETVVSRVISYHMPEIMERFLTKYPESVDRLIFTDTTSLIYALSNISIIIPTIEDRRMITLLLAHGANANFITSSGSNPLFKLSVPDLEIYNQLIEAGAVPQTDHLGYTPLIGSASSDLASLNRMIEIGVDPFAINHDGLSALHFVCNRANYELDSKSADTESFERIARLVRSPDDLNYHRNSVEPAPTDLPLISALSTNNMDCVHALINAGARWDVINYPASYTASHPQLASMTVAERAQQLRQNNYPNNMDEATAKFIEEQISGHGNPPVSQTQALTNLLIATIQRAQEESNDDAAPLIADLIKQGADVNGMSFNGDRPLTVITTPKLSLIKQLLDAGADPDQGNNIGFNILSNTAIISDPDALTLLGKDLNYVGIWGITPLQTVCLYPKNLQGQPDTTALERIHRLIDTADKDVINRIPQPSFLYSSPPLFAALFSNNLDCIQAMIQAGARWDATMYAGVTVRLFPELKNKTVLDMARERAEDPSHSHLNEEVRAFILAQPTN